MTPSIGSQGYAFPQLYATLDLARTPAIGKELRNKLLSAGPMPQSLQEVEACERELDATLRDRSLAYIFVGCARFEVVSAFEASLWRDERREKAGRIHDSVSLVPAREIERAAILSNSLAPEYLESIETISGVSSLKVDLVEFVNGGHSRECARS